MEESAMDELYGDFGQEPYDSSLNHDENSVDIYSGLDDAPHGDGNMGKDGTFLSPRRLKESMDLYEELITEEQEEKETTYNELKIKFDAAQSQVQELLVKLQQMQTKNSSLHKENTLLKKNICALIKTARMEIVRKDEEINKLNRSGRGRFHPSRIERNQESCLKSQVNTIHPSVSSPAGPFRETQPYKGDLGLAESTKHKEASRPSTDASTSSSFTALQKCTRSDLKSSLNCRSKDSDGIVGDHHRAQSSKMSSCKERDKTCSETAVVKSQSGVLPGQKVCEEKGGRRLDSREGGKDCHAKQSSKKSTECNSKEKHMIEKNLCDVNRSERVQSELEKMDSNKSQCQPHEDPVVLRRSGRSKSPFPQPEASPSTFHSQTSRGQSRVTVDTQTQIQKQELWHNKGEDRHSRSGNHSESEKRCSEKSDTSLDRKMEKKGSREHHRKEERRQDDVSSSERRHTRSEGSKNFEQKKTRESEGRGRHEERSSSKGDRRSTRSEVNKEHHQNNSIDSCGELTKGAASKDEKRVKDRRMDVRKDRRDSSPVKHGDHERGRTQQKDFSEDISKNKSHSKKEEQLSRSKASSSRVSKDGKTSHASHASSERKNVKQKCTDVDYDKDRKRADKYKRLNAVDGKSENGVPASDVTKSTSPGKSRTSDKGHVGETLQKHGLADVNKQSSLPTKTCAISAMTEESSPKRKLSFMETLNLTLSPVKKPNHQSQPDKAKEPTGQLSDDAPVNNSSEEMSFVLGEEFCVIDETEKSQEPVETVEENSATTKAGALPLEPSNSETPPSQSQDRIHSPKELKTDLQDMKGKDKGPELSEAICEDVFTTPSKKMCLRSNTQEKTITKADDSAHSAASKSEKCTKSSQGVIVETVIAEVLLPLEGSVPVNSMPAPLTENVCKDLDLQTSVGKSKEKKNGVNSRKTCQNKNQPEKKAEAVVKTDVSQEVVSTSVKMDAMVVNSSNIDTSVSLEVVSSTVSVDINPPSKQSSANTLAAISDRQITEGFEKPKPLEGTPAQAVSTALREKEPPQEQVNSSEPDSTENELQISRPFSSAVVPQDEDSMMLTLSSIRVIPEAISPLTSPIRQMKNAQQHCVPKEPHVKSLSKDLSTSAIVPNKDIIKMDMNKENKRPDLSCTDSIKKDQQEVLSSTATEEELEEGEIVSKSDDENSLGSESPQNVKTKPTLRKQPSPRSPQLEKRTQIKPAVTPTREQDGNQSATSNDSPSFNKRRFKTITVPSKAKVSTSAEFMNMLLFIRSELRRKYMKLHKNVTKSAFCCIVDMSLASYTEFVDGVNFHTFCSQGNEIKPRLNKIISSVMNKVSNNGIVKRIFEQRADDLKQKLWNFVDGQFDFLFKELKAALKGVSGLANNKSTFDSKYSSPRVKDGLTVDNHTVQAKKPLCAAEHRPNQKDKAEAKESRRVTLHSLPCKGRGLGSRGKNIKATMEEDTQVSEVQSTDQLPTVSSSEKPIRESVPTLENKASTYVRRLSHSGSIHDRTDFEILTEQQASSLTFNLVTDSQMGDIFRCLLQGSDFLEASVSAGDNHGWPLNTPRKEATAGESLIGVVTPNKIITPSKLITTWTPISPYKFGSPNGKIQIPINPALFDESCLLEVPSNALSNQNAPNLCTVTSQQSYSILAEDLAVSLTIPSPLKSDGHLSFLNPASGQPLSTPSSVISAHYSEDALLDGEDATEQDIHLSLDTDNSSRSSAGETWQGAACPPVFQFKPNLPMQAEVMERSNDHFIVRIRHTSTGPLEEPKKEEKEVPSAVETSAVCLEDKPSVSDACLDSAMSAQPAVTSDEGKEAQISSKGTSFPASLSRTTENSAEQVVADVADTSSSTCITGGSEKEECSESNGASERVSRKRRKHHSGPKAKRSKTEKHQDKREKQRHKKRSKSRKECHEKTPPKKGSESPKESPKESPNLSAKNVIRKKGEVVVTWTRDEDRDILLQLKMKGASSKTFAALSTKLKKSQAQIEERFSQLMKLFKKKEKMEG